MVEPSKQTMRAIVLTEYGKPLEVKEVPIPVPKSGQVLIKMEAAPINPSDMGFIEGNYRATNKKLPTVPGFEGSGTVVQSGGGMIAWSMVGKRVAVAAPDNLDGTWAEYMVTDAVRCLPVPNEISLEEAASTFVNPLTVASMLEIAKAGKHTAVIQTAACSQLGRMFIRYFQANGIRTINVVRRAEQLDILKNEGAEVVLNSTDPTFDDDLKTIARKLNATLCFEAVSGQLTARILRNMPHNSTVYVYGALSMEGVYIDASELIFRGKTVKGFLLPNYLKTKNLVGQAMMVYAVRKLLKTQLKTNIIKEIPFEEINESLAFYKGNMTAGKILIKHKMKPSEKEITTSGKE